jgi:hypothetical protein
MLGVRFGAPAQMLRLPPTTKFIWHCFGLFPARRATIMVSQRTFIFKSEAKPDLRAFGGDLAGSQLPSKFKPWRAVGAVAPDQQPPYRLPRDVIERAIKDQGLSTFSSQQS